MQYSCHPSKLAFYEANNAQCRVKSPTFQGPFWHTEPTFLLENLPKWIIGVASVMVKSQKEFAFCRFFPSFFLAPADFTTLFFPPVLLGQFSIDTIVKINLFDPMLFLFLPSIHYESRAKNFKRSGWIFCFPTVVCVCCGFTRWLRRKKLWQKYFPFVARCVLTFGPFLPPFLLLFALKSGWVTINKHETRKWTCLDGIFWPIHFSSIVWANFFNVTNYFATFWC